MHDHLEYIALLEKLPAASATGVTITETPLLAPNKPPVLTPAALHLVTSVDGRLIAGGAEPLAAARGGDLCSALHDVAVRIAHHLGSPGDNVVGYALVLDSRYRAVIDHTVTIHVINADGTPWHGAPREAVFAEEGLSWLGRLLYHCTAGATREDLQQLRLDRF